jgi:hypothetical protein
VQSPKQYLAGQVIANLIGVAVVTAVNGGNLRCRRDENGVCIEVQPCRGGYHRDPTDACLSKIEERAWSSPIFVDFAG